MIPTEGRLHFVGIGGIGMSALAQVLARRGRGVSGSDQRDSALLVRLRNAGIDVAVGHEAAHAEGAAALIVSDAVPPDNPEVVWATTHDIPVFRRSEALGELMRDYRTIAIAGTHGKTTTTAMVALILEEAGLEPTVLLGGELTGADRGNAWLGGGEFLVAEACEAFNSFLDFAPEVAVVTNLEAEHLDFHHTEERLRDSFRRFLAGVSGAVVLNLDQPDLLDLVEPGRTVVTFALEPVAGGREADLCAEDLRLEGTQSRFRLVTGGQARVEVRLPVPGRHNVANALAAAAAARCLDISFADIAEALGRFPGVGRRFELVGYCRGAAVVDDYAHHPTEIRATLAAARGAATGRVIAIFQPHLFTRTRDFLDEFAHALLAADEVFVTDIYAARERPIPGVSGEGIVIRAREIDATKELHYLTPKEAVIDELMPRLEPGDLVLTMGAGDIRCVAEALVQQGGERK